MMANCRRCLGLQSTLAPASVRTQNPVSVGKNVVIAGRETWGRRRICQSAAAIVAPEFPADTIASARLSATSVAATLTEWLGFLLQLWVALSSMASTVSQAIMRIGRALNFRRPSY